jgi:transcriptional antiterminator RfaH
MSMNPTTPAWYCLRALQKHEHIAAANLRQLAGVEVFNPRMRVRRRSRTGILWVSEPLFPSYVFARFALQPMLDPVRYTAGVKHVVSFGDRWPTIPDVEIEQLRLSMGGEECIDSPPEFLPGDEVEILEGPFLGLSAVVERQMPSTRRVRVLLELLGRATCVEIAGTSLRAQERYPSELTRMGAAA